MRHYLTSLLLILSLSACQTSPPPVVISPEPITNAVAKSTEQLVRKNYTSQLDQETHQYFVYLPRGYADNPGKKWPVLLFLHGNGERGNGRDELDYVLSHGPLYEAWIQKRDLPFIIISPQLAMLGMESVPYIAFRKPSQIPVRLENGVPARDGFFATQGVIKPAVVMSTKDMKSIPPLLPVGWDKVEQDLLSMIAQTQQDYAADPSRIYLSGLSYGGFGTWFMASKHPDLFAAIMPVVGWGHPDLMAPIAKQQVPVWVFAGGRDSAVEKKFFYPGLQKLEELGATEVRFTVEEDMGHDTWKRVYARDDVYQWLLQHVKTPH